LIPDMITDVANNLNFIFERLDWLAVLDIMLVTLIIFAILRLVRDTQAVALLRGVIILITLIALLSSLEVLPAFSWLVSTTLPALLLAIPVIFAPEIRRALERLGRVSPSLDDIRPSSRRYLDLEETIKAVVEASSRLSNRKHGALIVMQRYDSLQDFIETGVRMEANVSSELLLQIFYPNTPLHDGAVIISSRYVVAAACIMPLSASGVLSRSPERQFGLRHRAALGISEVSDAVAVVVSEETGSISVVHGGRMIRRLDPERLENILLALYRSFQKRTGFRSIFQRWFPDETRESQEEE
jgi:diadenylate cyclase